MKEIIMKCKACGQEFKNYYKLSQFKNGKRIAQAFYCFNCYPVIAYIGHIMAQKHSPEEAARVEESAQKIYEKTC